MNFQSICIFETKISWKKLKKKKCLFFTKEFLFLLESGLTYLEILKLMTQYEKNKELKKMMEHIRNEIQKGNCLYDSFSKYLAFFGEFYLNILYIGEQSGSLEKSLRLLVQFLEEKQKMRKQLQSILLYPLILIAFAGFVVVAMLYFILPTFVLLAQDMGMELPFITRVLLHIKNFLPWTGLFCLLLILGGDWILNKKHSSAFQRKIDFFLFHHCFQKGLYSRVIVHRLSKYFEIFLEAGFSFQQILPVIEKITSNREMQRRLEKVSKLLYGGSKISQSFSHLQLFSTQEMYLLHLGEESGNLVSTFQKISFLLEEEIREKLQRYFILIEPCIFIILGLLFGFIILGIYLPILSFNSFV